MDNYILKYSLNKVQIVLLIILAILIPSGFYKFEGVFIGLLFLNGFVLMKGYRQFRLLTKESILLMLFFTLYLLGFLFTDNLSQQYRAVTQHSSFLLLPLSFLGFKISDAELLKIKKCFIWSTVIFILIAFGYAFYSTILTGKSTIYVNDSVQSKFMYYGLTRVFKNWHPTYVSLFANLSIVFAYHIYMKKKQYFVGILISIICIMSILLLNSFIGIITLGVTLYIAIYMYIKDLWKNILLLIIFIVLSFSFYQLNPFNNNKITQLKETGIKISDKKEERNMLNLRMVKWEASYSLFKSSPIFGVTSGDLKDKMVIYYEDNGFDYAAKHRFSSHNQYLSTLAAYGIVGFLLFIIIILYSLKFGSEMSMFLMLFSIFCLTEDILERQQGLIFFVFMYMLLSNNTKRII